jgi:hypothetical protein
MSDFIEFETKDGSSIFIEATEECLNKNSEEKLISINEHVSKTTRSLKEALAPVSEVISATLEALSRKDLRPNKLEVELGLKFSGDANIIISKVSGEVALKIKATWENKNT